MKSMKAFVLLFVLLLGSTVFTGCSTTEKEFYALQKEYSTLDTYVNTGEISFSINQFPTEITGDSSIAEGMLLQLFKNLTLSYTQKVDMDKELISTSFYLKLLENAEPQEIVSIIWKDHVAYIRVDELAKFLKPFATPEMTPYLDAVEGQKYLTISQDELSALLNPDGAAMQTNSLQYLWDTDKMESQRDLYLRLFEELMADVYDQYETGVVKKQGNKFTITLTTQEIIDLIRPFLVYSVDHADKLDAFLMSTVENLTDEEMEMLNLDPAERETYLQGITEAINQIKLVGPELIDEWDATQQETTEEIIKVLGDSKFTAAMQKTDAKTFDTTMELLLQINMEEIDQPLEFSLKAKDQVKKSSSFDVTAPKSDLISLSEISAKLPLIMEIQPDYSFYVFNHGFTHQYSDMETSIENDRTYVPIRQVAEAFREKTGWDKEKRQAFVERDKERIYFAGIVKDGRVFVSVKEFEKLGYEIDWDELNRIITIKKIKIN